MRPVLQKILNIPEETNEIEFKRVSGDGVVKKILQTIVAMANTDGGVIILGVDDPEKTKSRGTARIFGIEEDKEKYDAVIQAMKNIMPPAIVEVAPIKYQKGKTVVLLTVQKASQSFHAFEDRVWIRLQKSNKKLTPHEVIHFSYAKGFEKADRELVDNVALNLLDTVWYRSWKDKKNLDPDDIGIDYVLRAKGLAREDNDILKPTRAAVLLFAEYPTNLIDTKCAVKVIAYRDDREIYGNTPNIVGVPKIIQGPIKKVIDETQEYVLNTLHSGIEISSGFRTKFKLPERAIKEGITNAVIHRDYHVKQDIEIKIFSDRVEIISPGLFPFNITKNNIGIERAKDYRNDSVVKVLREFPNPPNLDMNEGVKAMRSEMQKENLHIPSFVTYPDLEDSVKLILSNEEISDEWEKIKKYFEKKVYINNKTAREVTGVTQGDRMSRMLNKWFKKGLLVKITRGSSKRYTYYALPDSGASVIFEKDKK